uniref:RING-type domain-containing protein n=1 Tax=Tetradesmus obliquus TaxID=3088 RepID=A0A383VAZ7_TETOB|eukprot:jgi/Sobl393_1/4851/SZX61784.1
MSSLSSALERMGLQNDDELELEVQDSVFTPAQAEEGDAAEEAASEASADDMTCAICLERTQLTELALVKGCEHQYCVNCILQWALCKEWCPQCKQPFDYLLCHKQLDGTLSDFLVEESVVLLKRARWFDDHMREVARKGAMPAGLLAVASSAAGADYDSDADARDWADVYEDYLDAELEEDEEIEQYYFSSAAGRARVVLGNRRWGEGGFMRAGRMYARPVQNNARTPNAAGGKSAGGKAAAGKGAGKAAAGGTSGGAGSSRAAADAGSSSSSSAAAAAASGMGGGSSSSAAASSVAITNRAGGSSSSAAAAAGSSSWAAAASSSSNRGRPVAPWLGQADDDGYCDDDFCLDDEDFPYAMGGSGGSSSRAGNSQRRSGSSSSAGRSRARPDRPAGMTKPLRQLPKNSPVVHMAAGPLVSPLGKSPGSGGFQVGSWGASSSSGACVGSYGASAGSTPGSGRRAKRNARRAAQDAGCGDGPEYD